MKFKEDNARGGSISAESVWAGVCGARRQVLDGLGRASLVLGVLGVLAGLSGCAPDKPGTTAAPEPASQLASLRNYTILLQDEIYRYRMRPLPWSVASDESYQRVRPCLEILGCAADHFASLRLKKAPWEEQAKAFEMHVGALMTELRRQGVFLGEEIQFDFANPRFKEVSALAQLLYEHVNGFLSTHGFWAGGFGLRLMPRADEPGETVDRQVSGAVGFWQRPAGLYEVSALNPPELLQVHPRLREATDNLVMLRRRSEPDLTQNIGLAPTVAALAEGQSVLILEDKLERDIQPLEELLERKAEQLADLASLDFATAAQGRVGYVKDPSHQALRVYTLHWRVMTVEDAAMFSLLKLAIDICSRFGAAPISPRLVRDEMAAFYAWHEVEHLKYARGDDENREVLNRAYLNVDALVHPEEDKAAALSVRARAQQEVEADLAGLAQAPAGGLLACLMLERHSRILAAPADRKLSALGILWRHVYRELSADPQRYGIVVVPEDKALTARLRSGVEPADLKAALQTVGKHGETSTLEREEFVLAPGAQAVWPIAQILGQIYRVAQSPAQAQILAQAVRNRLALDERRDALAREIQSDQEPESSPRP